MLRVPKYPVPTCVLDTWALCTPYKPRHLLCTCVTRQRPSMLSLVGLTHWSCLATDWLRQRLQTRSIGPNINAPTLTGVGTNMIKICVMAAPATGLVASANIKRNILAFMISFTNKLRIRFVFLPLLTLHRGQLSSQHSLRNRKTPVPAQPRSLNTWANHRQVAPYSVPRID